MKTKEIQKELLVKNILYLGGDVNTEMQEYVVVAMAELMSRGSPPIKVHITSGGGRVRQGLDIYDMISVYPNKVDGTVVAYARSMAVVILQACTTRSAYHHSKILIHHISTHQITLDIMRSEKKKVEVLRDMEKDQTYLYRILSDRTGKTVDQISRICKRNEDMTASEAKDFGLIDSIVLPRAFEGKKNK